MKFGAVREVNSLSTLMIAREDHDRALSAAPKPRHHLQVFFKKLVEYQNDNERRGMIHNHPSNHPAPSKPDIEMTRQIREVVEKVGIVLHDHLIVSKRGQSSFRQMGLMGR